MKRTETYTIFWKIERISDLLGLCPMENEAAFVTLQNFGRSAYGMFWSTEEMMLREEIPVIAEMKPITIAKVGYEAGYDVLTFVWEDGGIIKAAIEDEVLDRIARI